MLCLARSSLCELGQDAIPYQVRPELEWHGQFDDYQFAVMHDAGNFHVFPNFVDFELERIHRRDVKHVGSWRIGRELSVVEPARSSGRHQRRTLMIRCPLWQYGAQFGMLGGFVRMLSRNFDRKVFKPSVHPRVASGLLKTR